MEQRFRAYRVFQAADGAVSGQLVEMGLDELGAGDVVVRVAWSGVNYKDALAATGAGRIMRRFPLVGGIDFAGTVVSSGAARFAPGDDVLATGYGLGESHDGGFAEYVRVPADWLLPLPTGIGLRDAMAIGTAGFTAALSVVEMERNGLQPDAGPVIVTGATGGVGSLAVQCLATAGYQVTALTRKDDAHAFLRAQGAADVLSAGTLTMGTRPLEKSLWAGAVDPVGGDTLAWLTRTMRRGGCIASSGLTGGTELRTTVMPFILRGVRLLGIDSALCPMEIRQEVWRRLGADLKPGHLAATTQSITLGELPAAFDTLLRGAARGRYVVQPAAEN